MKQSLLLLILKLGRVPEQSLAILNRQRGELLLCFGKILSVVLPDDAEKNASEIGGLYFAI